MLSTLNYVVAMTLAGAVLAVVFAIMLGAEGGLPNSMDQVKIVGIVLAGVATAGAILGLITSLIRTPRLRSRLESRVLAETRARFAEDGTYPRVRNLLDGLAIAAGIPPPTLAVIDDPAPNSFGVGTQPETTVIAITTGLIESLTRAQLEAILAYEVTRVASFDVAVSSWIVALTGGSVATLDIHPVAAFVGRPLRWFAQRIQRRALRHQAEIRDADAISMSRNPAQLVAALERLAADNRVVLGITPATAPLWVEVPETIVTNAVSSTTRAALQPLLLTARIARLREHANLPPLKLGS